MAQIHSTPSFPPYKVRPWFWLNNYIMHLNPKLICLSVFLLLGFAIASPLNGNCADPPKDNTYTEQLFQNHESHVHLISPAVEQLQDVPLVWIVSDNGYLMYIRLTPHFE